MQAIYVTRPGNNNRELRMSLRTLANIEGIDSVAILGHEHDWTTNVIKVPVEKTSTAWQHVIDQLEAACNDERVEEDLLLLNDDFFVLTPTTIKTYHRGTIQSIVERYERAGYNTRYIQGMRDTMHLLQEKGIQSPLCYELHVPMPVKKSGLKEAVEISKQIEGFGKRSIYGNIFNVGGTQMEDVKLTLKRRARKEFSPFISTDDDSFIILGINKRLQKMFPDRSKYELY